MVSRIRNERLSNYVRELFKNDIMNAKSECGGLPRLIVEYLIARYFERWGASITRTKLMKLLAAALFINPDTKEIDIHELARCFKYRIYKYPVYSPVVNEAIKELDREGRITVRVRHRIDADVHLLVLIVRGEHWRGSRDVLEDLRRGQYGEWESLIGRIDRFVDKYGPLNAGELRDDIYEIFAITPSIIGSGHDLVDYLRDVKEAREVGRKVPEDRLYHFEL